MGGRRDRGREDCRKPKHMPYGTTGTNPFCHPHDSCMTYDVSKRAERRKAKEAIKKARREELDDDY